jgi:hypothetical protein
MRQSSQHFSHHRPRLATRGPALALIGIALALVLLAGPVTWAAIGLSKFEAKAEGNTILVVWETQTELNTAGFRLYRAEGSPPADWGDPIHSEVARGGMMPTSYSYRDELVQAGILYYYLLEDLATDGTGSQHGPVSAGVGMAEQPTATPTVTRTASPTLQISLTPSATRTRFPTITPTATGLPQQPTATRQFENSPTVPPTATATFGSAFDSGVGTPTPSPTAGIGQVSTPTPGAGQAVLPPPRIVPTLTPTLFVPTAVILPTDTPTLELNVTPKALLARLDTPEPEITNTPAVFEAVRSDASAQRRPTPAAQESVRNSSVAFALGGGAVVFALLLGVTGFFLWRARH